MVVLVLIPGWGWGKGTHRLRQETELKSHDVVYLIVKLTLCKELEDLSIEVGGAKLGG